MNVFGAPHRGSSCMVCGADLWDVERYVSAGTVQVCSGCVDAMSAALEQTDAIGEIEVVPAPKVYGSAPSDEAPALVAQAFTRTFGTRAEPLVDHLEDAAELGPLLREGAARHGAAVDYGVRINAIRFPGPDLAEVRFQIVAGNAPTGFAFQGTARLQDGRWRVTRETVARMLATIGISVRLPRRPMGDA